eukprot:m.19065 g.19065  ORF g.19065 m.19065 type:complete len:342 (+) comp6477_c0_seq2:59-1084(+)
MVTWGICGSGKICHDFGIALLSTGQRIKAVGASNIGGAEKLAKIVGAETAYGSYEELAKDPEIDIVYIGTIHPMHKKHTLLMFEHGKNVLCEKPITINAKDAKELVDVARAKNLFLMEGMWTRFFPAVKKVQEVIASGAIGEVKSVTADFGFLAPDDITRLFDKKMGGGVTLDIGVYPLTAAFLGFKERATEIKATGILSEGGVDLQTSVALKFGKEGTATVDFTLLADTPEETTYIGTKGIIKICNMAHAPTKIIIKKAKPDARGQFDLEELSFPLPPSKEGAPSLKFPNSEGFQYQAEAVTKCIEQGLKECPTWTLDDTLDSMRVVDEVLGQVGVKYDS